MTGLRVITVTPLGHGSDCRICATVDTWAANRKRPASRRADEPDLTGGIWGAAASRDVVRQSGEAPDAFSRLPGEALAGSSVPPGRADAEAGVSPGRREPVHRTSASGS